ncbi:MAG: flagellar protein FlgN [Bacillota bacterium]|nr:flagellar protein FlgN [Bacillota bacterium]
MARKKNEEARVVSSVPESPELPEAWKEEFTARLFRQEQLYVKLLELAREKRQVLLAGPVGQAQIGALESILKEETILLAEVRVLEETRDALFERLEREFKQTQDDACPAGLDLMKQVQSCAVRCLPDLADRYASLYVLLEELRRLNRENGEILERFQRYVEFSLDLLGKSTENGTYQQVGTKKGAVKKAVSPQSRIIRRV